MVNHRELMPASETHIVQLRFNGWLPSSPRSVRTSLAPPLEVFTFRSNKGDIAECCGRTLTVISLLSRGTWCFFFSLKKHLLNEQPINFNAQGRPSEI